MMAFDSTYLTTTLAQMLLHNSVGLVGGVWASDGMDQSFLKLDDDIDVGKVVKASSLLEAVIWDPAASRKVPLSVCCVPVETNFTGPGSTLRGSYFMLELMGKILQESGCLLRAVTFDAHGSHSLIRRILHGQLSDVNMDDVGKMNFWKDLTFEPLPHDLPRLPIQKCMHHGEPFFGIPGVCLLTSLFPFFIGIV